MEFDQELDTSGLLFPLPILKTKVAIDKLQPGDVLKVVSTDAGSVLDVQVFAEYTRNALVDSQVDGKDHIYYLSKNGAL